MMHDFGSLGDCEFFSPMRMDAGTPSILDKILRLQYLINLLTAFYHILPNLKLACWFILYFKRICCLIKTVVTRKAPKKNFQTESSLCNITL